MIRHFWSQAEDTLLRFWHRQQLKYAAIARRLRLVGHPFRSANTVRNRAHRLGLAARTRSRGELVRLVRLHCQPGRSDAIVAGLIGTHKRTVTDYRHRLNIPSGFPPKVKGRPWPAREGRT